MKSEKGNLEEYYTKSHQRRYKLEIRHLGLNKYRVIKDDDQDIVERKALNAMAEWDQMWERKEANYKKKSEAAEKTQLAQKNLTEMNNILAYGLSIDPTPDWESLKKHLDFPKPKPEMLALPKKREEPIPPLMPEIPREPLPSDKKYNPQMTFLDRRNPSKRAAIENITKKNFKTDHKNWQKDKADTEVWYETAEKRYKQQLSRNEQYTRLYKAKIPQHEKEVEIWAQERDAFIKKTVAELEKKKKSYLKGDTQGILDYCDLVLSNSSYPDNFPQAYELDYNPEAKILIVDYQLPSINEIPTLKEVKYVQSGGQFSEKHISQTELKKIYDKILFQITLRTIHELFGADQISAIQSIAFNGYVNSIDPSTGQEINFCILTLQVGKGEFRQINLSNVEPQACFKKLKGVSASKLSSLTPIAPLLKIDREDDRFVQSYDVAEDIEGENLAAMDWEDFEHLIREIFENEFSSTGGEVKVTRASRDGGIDAVVFDPDPLRGGKIIIQAKRYTNTVGVSAVRDLYGTLINEGASRGILVTTADYGPDAYEFAKGKPIVLLSGAQLLFLLERHGHKARIDTKEAKQILADKKS